MDSSCIAVFFLVSFMQSRRPYRVCPAEFLPLAGLVAAEIAHSIP